MPKTMTLPTADDVLTVTLPELALLLRRVEQIKLLLACMGPEGCTLSAVAALLNLPLNVACRWVRRLERLGALRVLRTQPRAGRAVRMYGCSARRFFIPKALMPLDEFIWEGVEPLMQTLRANLQPAFEDHHPPVAGVLVGDLPNEFLFTYADDQQRVWPPEGLVPSTVSVMQMVRMDYAQARAFNRDLRALVERYAAGGGAGNSLLGLFVTPIQAGHALD